MTSLLARKEMDITELQKVPCKLPASGSAAESRKKKKKADKTPHHEAACDGQPKNHIRRYVIRLPIGVDDSNDGPFVPSARAPNVAPCF